jgi:DNA-binding transcriptional MocR family regulator
VNFFFEVFSACSELWLSITILPLELEGAPCPWRTKQKVYSIHHIVQWFKLIGVKDSAALLPEFLKGGVITVPGKIAFYATALTSSTFVCPYIRLSFSHASESAIQEGVRRMAQVLRDIQKR